MKIYKISKYDNCDDLSSDWYLNDLNYTKEQIIQQYKNLIVKTVKNINQSPKYISCMTNDDAGIETYYGSIHYEDRHVEFSLVIYTEEQFYERIAADENFIIGEEFVFDSNILGLEGEYFDYIDKMLQPTA